MLRRIRLEHFLTFDRIEFDLTERGGGVKNHAFIYGENGSGKSSLVDSIQFLRETLGTYSCSSSMADSDRVVLEKFAKMLMDSGIDALDSLTHPDNLAALARDRIMAGVAGGMTVEYTFSIGGRDATYRLVFDADGSLAQERLDHLISKRMGNLYTMVPGSISHSSSGLFSAQYSKEISGLVSRFGGKHTLLSILIKEMGSKNASYIRDNISENLISFINEVSGLVVLNHSAIRDGPMPNGPIRGTISRDRERELDRASEALSKFLSRIYPDFRGLYYEKELEGGKIRYSLHIKRLIAGEVRDIPGWRESNGNKEVMGLLSVFLDCAAGRTVVFDEIDTGIHDLLMSELIRQCVPDITGQLIATTHNSYLMESDAAPNLYVIRVDRRGFREIRSIQEIEPPNKNTSVRRRYMDGYYGGVPMISDIGIADILRGSEDDR